MLKVTLLVDDDVLGQYFAEKGESAFLDNATDLQMLEIPSGQARASMVKVTLSEQAKAQILAADREANTRGWTPSVQITEYPDEPISF